MPTSLRANTLVIVDVNSPHFIIQLSDDEKRLYYDRIDAMASTLGTMGFYKTIVVTKDFNELDYGDMTHLSVTGGQKLADRVAPEIIRMAADLGYRE
jgi:hypothetical protein